MDALKPEDKPWIAWDSRVTGFGVRVYPSGQKSFVVNYRSGDGGRNAPNKRVVVGRAGRVAPDQARRLALELLGRVAAGEDPAGERAEARGLPRPGEAWEEYIASGTAGRPGTSGAIAVTRPSISATGFPPSRFHHPPRRRGPLQAPYQAPRRDARQPVPVVPAFSRPRAVRGLQGSAQPGGAVACSRGVLPPQEEEADIVSETLPCWRKGIEVVVRNAVHRDVFLFGLYTGMRRKEIMALRWSKWTWIGDCSGWRRPRPGCRWSLR